MFDEPQPGIVVPFDQLSQVALGGLIEEFILREGTDYGVNEYTLEEKKNHVLKQLKAGHISVVYDPNIESSSILRKEDIPK